MVHLFKIFILFVFMTILHWVGVSFMGIFRPDVMFIFAMALAVCALPLEGYIFIFLSGLFLDFWGSSLFGGYALTFCLIAYAIYFLRDRMNFENIISQVVLIFVASLFAGFAYSMTSYIFSGIYISETFVEMFRKALFDCIFAPIIFFIVFKVMQQK